MPDRNENDQDNMVLRTVYFPAELDEELKQLAFSKSTSKGELIRRAVRMLVEEEAAVAAPVGAGDGVAPGADVVDAE